MRGRRHGSPKANIKPPLSSPRARVRAPPNPSGRQASDPARSIGRYSSCVERWSSRLTSSATSSAAGQRQLKRARIGVVVFALVSLAAIGSAAIALFQQAQLRKQSQLALEQRQLAVQLGRTAEEKAAEAANSRLLVLGFGDGPGPSRHGTRAAGFSRRSRRGAQVRDRDGGQQPGSCGRVE